MRAEGIYDVDANTSIDQLSEDLNIKMPEVYFICWFENEECMLMVMLKSQIYAFWYAMEAHILLSLL